MSTNTADTLTEIEKYRPRNTESATGNTDSATGNTAGSTGQQVGSEGEADAGHNVLAIVFGTLFFVLLLAVVAVAAYVLLRRKKPDPATAMRSLEYVNAFQFQTFYANTCSKCHVACLCSEYFISLAIH